MSQEGHNKVYMVNDGMNEFLRLDTKGSLRRINLGVRTFQRCRNKNNGDKIVYRITQEGMEALFPCFTKRKVKTDLQTLLFLANNQNLKYEEIPAHLGDLKKFAEDPELGYFALYILNEDGSIKEMASIVKFATSMLLMSSDEAICALKIKYEEVFSEVMPKNNAPKKLSKKEKKEEDDA